MVHYNNSLLSVLLVVGLCVIRINNTMLKKKIADTGACSLHPTAMFLMLGFFMRLPNVLRNTSYEFLKQQGGYFIRRLLNQISI